MISTINTVSRKVFKLPVKHFSVSSPALAEKIHNFRATETDCLKLNNEHLGLFYKISDEDRKHLFLHGGLPKTFTIQTKTFNETCFMIREPALDVINCLKNMDYSKPVVRFVLYGEKGSGKSLSLAHILHYAYKSGFFIVHVPWVGSWMRRCKEYSNSETKEGYVDLNMDAAAWLVNFKSQNSHLLSNAELKISQDYVWSKREATPAGSNIFSLADHGINRIKYASDTVTAICKEVKKLSHNGVIKTLVAIDGFNAFFYPNTRVYTEKKEMVPPEKVTLTEGFRELSKFDWKNGAVVVTVDEIAIAQEDHKSPLPRFLLSKEGFEHLDPFIPISVHNYSDKELKSCMEYYKDRKWVKDFPGIDEEVKFVSNSNPYRLLKVCAPL